MQLKSKSTQNSSSLIALKDSKPQRTDPEVPEKKTRRRFTAQYKLRILKEIDDCTD